MRAIEKTWPVLASSLGERFGEAFTRYAGDHAVCNDPSADGYRFALWLKDRAMLSDDGHIDLIRWQAARGGFMRVDWLRDSRSLILAFRLRGPRLFRLRL
jgi:hypothetical protein